MTMEEAGTTSMMSVCRKRANTVDLIRRGALKGSTRMSGRRNTRAGTELCLSPPFFTNLCCIGVEYSKAWLSLEPILSRSFECEACRLRRDRRAVMLAGIHDESRVSMNDTCYP